MSADCVNRVDQWQGLHFDERLKSAEEEFKVMQELGFNSVRLILEYVVWKDKNFNEEECSAVYSDRLFQWNYEKYNKCCQEVFKNQGQQFYEREPKEIEKFLGMYFEKQIKLTAIVQGCNQSSGYPYWVFYFK